MIRYDTLRGLLVLYEGPLSEVEGDVDGGLELDLRAHPALFGLGAQVVAVERVALRGVHHLEHAVDVVRQLLLARVRTVAQGVVEAALALLRQVVVLTVVIAACVARVRH